MKKIVTCVCSFILVMSISCSAFAWETPINATWFDIDDVQCVNTTTLKYWDYASNDFDWIRERMPYKSFMNDFYDLGYNTEGRLYVNHTVTGGGGNVYTNLIHAVRVAAPSNYETPSEQGTLCGQKWVTPGMWIPIESNAIYDESFYSVAVRGNTKHHENYGATTIDFHIGVEANQ